MILTSEAVMLDTEAIVRTSFRNLMDNPRVLEKFLSKERDEYLSEMLAKKANRVLPLKEPPRAGHSLPGTSGRRK
jgi:hypothetical protein